jgi:hypothetical protein
VTGSGEWFRVLSGEHEGRWHLSGWMGHAILVGKAGRRLGEVEGWQWLAISVCPRCRATIVTETAWQVFPYGDQQWAHEDWHAATDYPHPEGS